MNEQVYSSITQELSEQPEIAEDRREQLMILSRYLVHNPKCRQLVFVCTHNARRSQFSQVWAQVNATRYGFHYTMDSGGTEVTRVHPQVLETLRVQGFRIKEGQGKNPLHKVYFSDQMPPILLQSKVVFDVLKSEMNPIAVMTCSDADQNCPLIPEAKSRFLLKYDDPGISDGTDGMAEMYLQRSRQIANEMNFLFNSLKHE